MRSPVDRYRTLPAFYEGRHAVAAARASVHARDARARRVDASDSREAAQEQRVAGQMAEESGLTRDTFFDRLRMVAVARAHVAETMLHVQALEEAAVDLDRREGEARGRAAQALRKGNKLSRWLTTMKRNERARSLARADTRTQEDYAWR